VILSKSRQTAADTLTTGWKSPRTSRETSQYRILFVGETWFGSDARAAFSALRRLGHSVQVLDENGYLPLQWQTKLSKGIRKVFRPLFVKELMLDACRIIRWYKPHCLFVFKGNWVHPEIVERCREQGIATVNYYPDVSFLSHGPYIPRTLPLYDHVFNTKSYGVQDMQSHLDLKQVSFLEPGYDPELHRPVALTNEDQAVYCCDVAFIGTWSPKKEAILSSLRQAFPAIRIKIWGFQWEKSHDPKLRGSILGHGVTGDEYTKAICGSSICLGLLSEAGKGASSGDLITARTFQIPACGAFMLHERNSQAVRYFEEGQDAEFFGSPEELAEKVSYYLSHKEKRQIIAQNGLHRSLQDGYEIDSRMRSVLLWLHTRVESRPKF
jgi:spore maturation protein CgeB